MHPSEEHVLVVGTTPDYIDDIRHRAPGSALFLTDPALRFGATEPCPPPWEECLCRLEDFLRVEGALQDHLRRWQRRLGGIACYDCESLDLAAFLALRLGLPFPSPQAVRQSRNKALCKELWSAQGLSCPKCRYVPTAEALVAFQRELGTPVVIKPLRGSGSALVFLCPSPESCRHYHALVLQGLRRHPSLGIEGPGTPEVQGILAEEALFGTEYSADFLITDREVRILRWTRKLPLAGEPFGTTEGYVLGEPPPESLGASLPETLRRSAESLGISRGFCMVDGIVRGKALTLLELAPRPGGDCLPPLLRVARKMDTTLLALAFARGESPPELGPHDGALYLGLRLLARREGILVRFDTEALERDPRILEIGGLRKPGHRIALPPEDYDSWVLGYAIARLDGESSPEDQAAELRCRWTAEVEG